MINEILVGIIVTLVGAFILWLFPKTKNKIIAYRDYRKPPKVTLVSEWRKAAEERRARADYKSDEEILAEAIQEYRETGKSTSIPTETLESLLRMSPNPPTIPPTGCKIATD